MKTLHRVKALAAYDGASLVIKAGQVYPGYILLKEAVRGILAYILEDTMGHEINEKTKLIRLLDLMPDTIIEDKQKEKICELIKAESKGLSAITSMDLDKLEEIRVIIKKLIYIHLNERK